MRIRHVDAFTSEPLTGNPAAVVDGIGLASDVMQRIALNQNLSETVFLLPPEDPANSARIRIFTPRSELPFAGHPTIAAAHILTEERIATPDAGASLLLETGAGIVPVAVAAGSPRYTMTQAPPQFRSPSADAGAVARALDLGRDDIVRVEDVSTGIWWTIAQVRSFDAMMRVSPQFALLQGLMLAVFCVGSATDGVDVHVRAFAVGEGIPEDPVTGSANGCIAAIVAKHAVLPAQAGEIAYVAEQGIEVAQPGRVYLRITDPEREPRVHAGGDAITVLRGELLLE
ncbi:MAG TPA: PhzF family phenazine biosynthesis protein [Dehalococcoidia bacterium]|nr:PhzF family phenazine biosynthesis protein [Dehalococcoidia bacterium]